MSPGNYKIIFADGIIAENSSITYSGATTSGLILGNELSLLGSSISFSANFSPEAGGGLFAQSAFISFTNSSAVFSLNKSDLGNRSVSKGAALYLNNSTMSFVDSAVSFFSNTAGRASDGNAMGGAVFSLNTLMDIVGSTVSFSKNSANYGGALYLENSSVVFTSASAVFLNNFSTNDGAAVFLKTSTIAFNDSFVLFEKNTAGKNAAIYAQDFSQIYISAQVLSVSFENNTSLSGGFGNDIYLENSFIELNASADGSIMIRGGLFISSGSSMNITGSGGLIYFGNSNRFERASSFSVSGRALLEIDGTDFQYDSNKSAISINDSSVIFKSLNNVFISNTGGVFKIENSTVNFESYSAFSNNQNALDGGALYIINSSVSFLGRAAFLNNTADKGAVVYASGSIISFKNAVLTGNQSQSGFDIYLDGTNQISFYIEDNEKVEMDGGLRGLDGDLFEKIGNGLLKIKGSIDFAGTFKLNYGTMTVSNPNIYISTFVINSARYSMHNPDYAKAVAQMGTPKTAAARSVYAAVYAISYSSPVITTVNSLTARASIFDFSLYFNGSFIESDKIIALDFIDIDGAQFNIDAYGSLTSLSALIDIEIIKASNTLSVTNFDYDGYINWNMDDGGFRQLPFSLNLDPSNNSFGVSLSTSMKLNILGLTHNQQETQNLLNKINSGALLTIRNELNLLYDNEIKRALDSISGVFLINALYNGAQKDTGARLYNRLILKTENDFDKKVNVWVQYDMDFNTSKGEETQSEKIKATASAIEGGFDLFNNESLILGIYAAQQNQKIKQDLDEADISAMGFGVYGLWHKDAANLLFNAGADLGDYNTTREIKSQGFNAKGSFKTTAIKGGAQLEIELIQDRGLSLRPYIEAQGLYLTNSKLEEKGGDLSLIMYENYFMRADAKGGFKVAYQESSYDFIAQIYAGYILTGNSIGYDMSFVERPESGKMNINNSDLGNLYYGASAALGYKISESFKLSANAGVNMNQNGAVGYFVQAGVNISIFSRENGKQNKIKKDRQKALKKAQEELEQKALMEAKRQEEEKLKDEEINLLQEEIERAKEEKLRAELAQFAARTLDEAALMEARDRRNKPDIKSFRLSAAIFAQGSPSLIGSSKSDIKRLADNIKKYKYTKVVVEGHADSTGKEERNLKLSQERARAVYNELYRNGIENMEYIGFGSALPATTNDTEIGRMQNRRVEVFVE
ncbi:MAG: OmpA family protein, partial [Elusimicrobiota bacterium]|jgi:predicted outer membrane repeat protein|nr:OmpA family protein [Elusimicrobiota bacterium]